jgi:hypothetical protein
MQWMHPSRKIFRAPPPDFHLYRPTRTEDTIHKLQRLLILKKNYEGMEMTATSLDALNTGSLTLWSLKQQCEYTLLSNAPPISEIGLLCLKVHRLRPSVFLMKSIKVKKSKEHWRKTELLGGKPVPVPLCPLQLSHQPRASVRGRRLPARDMAGTWRPHYYRRNKEGS